ncbi:Co2+/Mg2+ efflux protein ApaG [Pseudidiomarina aquimaris]|uniref:Protein ApaG n=1 Tax=Pseudidiomarina aquimaris TaxID=641841 RepID=A0A432XEQ0_9GAMM|nr:Co2+/Mg2+ efflux protein ApaG [Pseudidiomarina aquimaris]RUO47213.1 Co2+/Mg2+ efflux protein ApaG [Pseudidiomarina aquimaris]|tara:strand:- start:350 stop:718 length:369 start_codon:yes stop_codon:yes gene_type:complete
MSTIAIDVKTHYLAAQSDPDNGQYVFAYTITITNQGEASVQLLNRAWRITDADHKITRVAGDGVVGEQPHIAPGESYSYTSGTVLATPIGTMEGHYGMIHADGSKFEAKIPSFRLAVPNILH